MVRFAGDMWLRDTQCVCASVLLMTVSVHLQLPVVDVVVLASPAPVLVGEAVDLQKLFFAQA